MLDSLTNYAIDYFRDKIKPEKKYKKPSNEEKKITFKSSRSD